MSFSANTEWRWQTPTARLAEGSGSTNIVGLSAIRQFAGDRWEKVRERVCSRLEAMFRQRLGPADFFVPVDQSSYLVIMPAATPEEGRICCLRIAYELHASLLGSCGVEHLDISRAEYLGGDVLEMKPLAHQELIELAKKADVVLAPPGSVRATPDFGDGAPRPAPAPNSEPPPAAGEVEVVYHPIWDAQFQVIRAFRCVAKRKFLGVVKLAPQEEARETAQVTLTALERGSQSLKHHLDHDERFMVHLPIPYAALSSAVARMEITSACRRLSCELRPYFVFKIEGMPVGLAHSRLIDLVTTVMPFCRAVIAKVPWNERRLEIYAGIGLKALGVSFEGVPEWEIPDVVERLYAHTKKDGLIAFADDVPNCATLRRCVDSGVKWLSGTEIIPAVGEPGPMVRRNFDSLLGNVAA